MSLEQKKAYCAKTRDSNYRASARLDGFDTTMSERENCNACHKCLENDNGDMMSFSMSRMILCPECGCKRCPKASDHELACTESNAPGQEGSIYQ